VLRYHSEALTVTRQLSIHSTYIHLGNLRYLQQSIFFYLHDR